MAGKPDGAPPESRDGISVGATGLAEPLAGARDVRGPAVLPDAVGAASSVVLGPDEVAGATTAGDPATALPPINAGTTPFGRDAVSTGGVAVDGPVAALAAPGPAPGPAGEAATAAGPPVAPDAPGLATGSGPADPGTPGDLAAILGVAGDRPGMDTV